MGNLVIVSTKHTKRSDKFITLWGVNNCGYCFRFDQAGRYSESLVGEKRDYYNNGHSTLAVMEESLARLWAESPPGLDHEGGLVIENTKENWEAILSGLVWKPENDPEPQYTGSPLRTRYIQ